MAARIGGSSDAKATSRRRAFISAPLIGTILFLAAVLFTVNLNKIEASQSARIVNDAYHNRIVSLIEIYRTDLNSVFRESVRRSIQQYILDPAWSNLALTNQGDGRTFTQDQPLRNIREVRKQHCELIKYFSRQVICGRETAGTIQINTFGYGIPAWVEVASREFSFEGISFRPANPEQMKLLNPPPGLAEPAASMAFNAYSQACSNLVQDNLFDCDYFANNPGRVDSMHPFGPFQCKDSSGQVLPGCEQGTFYVRVDPRGVTASNTAGDGKLFAALPRIEGDDGFGNQVRSGAIGDEPFYLPINLRVFFYSDLALDFYDKLAFSPNGLLTGICVGSSQSCSENRPPKPPYNSNIGNLEGLGREEVVKNRAANELFQRYREAVTALRDRRSALMYERSSSAPTGYHINFHLLFQDNPPSNLCLDSSTRQPAPVCRNVHDSSFTVNPAVIRNIPGLDPKPDFVSSPPAPDKVGAYYDDVVLNFFVLDTRPEFKVAGNEPNHPAYPMVFSYRP